MRIDAIVNDEMATNFKVEVIRRLGGKKGDFSRALGIAMENWIKVDLIDKLKESIKNSISDPEVTINLVQALKAQGPSALPALIDVSGDVLDPSVSKEISIAIKEVASQR